MCRPMFVMYVSLNSTIVEFSGMYAYYDYMLRPLYRYARPWEEGLLT